LDLVDSGLRAVFRRLVTAEAPWPLFLYGDVGTGKTAAALCLCDHVENSYYRTVRALADNRMSKGDDLSHIGTVRLAVLDEIGAREKVGDLFYDVVKDFLEARERHHHVAVYISNLDVQTVASLFDDRVADRLACGTVFQLSGVSRRRSAERES
jgi:DNA replication protein DnaC